MSTDISEEANHLALVTREQTRLVNEQADALDFEDQDIPGTHHGHSRRYIRPLHSATILQFTSIRRKMTV
jgi:hypothetical protein